MATGSLLWLESWRNLKTNRNGNREKYRLLSKQPVFFRLRRPRHLPQDHVAATRQPPSSVGLGLRVRRMGASMAVSRP